jgi:hypothetical protein
MINAARVALPGTVVDLSVGGVRVRRTDDSAPCPGPGTAAKVTLEIGDRGWVTLDGRIHRCGLDEIVIAFGPLPADVERLIEDAVLAEVDAARRPRMMVVDGSAERRRRVADALRVAGCDSYEAATPLEAIDLMGRPRNHIKGVAIAESLTQTSADELCDFFAESNPEIKLALIADGSRVDVRFDRSGTGDRVAVMSSDDTLENSLRSFADSVSSRTDRDL